MQRTQDEILARIEAREPEDLLGFELPDYIERLDFEHAQPFLNEGVTADDWPGYELKDPKQYMIDYMEVAFPKAHGERGISANRSIQHMIAWSWLSGDDELNQAIEWEFQTNYHGYGLGILRMICEILGIDPKEHGDC